MSDNFVRKNCAIVNSDKGAYLAAKIRKQRDKQFKLFEEKINTLEDRIILLEIQIKEMTK